MGYHNLPNPTSQPTYDPANIERSQKEAIERALMFSAREPILDEDGKPFWVFRLNDKLTDSVNWNYHITNPVKVEIAAFPVIKRTKCAIKIWHRFAGKEVQIYNFSPRPYAHKDPKRFIQEFRRRKQCQLDISRRAMLRAENALHALEYDRFDGKKRPSYEEDHIPF